MDSKYKRKTIKNDIFKDGESYDEQDTLGFTEAKDVFVKVIQGILPPMTVGLYGRWGSGKSWMIEGIKKDLEDQDYLTIVFDAWKYRNESNLILPLICSLQREHLSNIDEAKDSAKKVITSAALVMANQFLKNKVGVDIGEVKTALQIYEDGYKHYKKYDDNVALIEEEYKDFIGVLLDKTGKKKLMVFIDNLDRCLPDTAVNLLEDISSFLSIKKVPCIYMLVMDRDNVIKTITHRYPDFNGADYLEKIVQIGLKMPIPDDPEKMIYHFMKRYEKAIGIEAVSNSKGVRGSIFKELIDKNAVCFGNEFLNNPRCIERMINKLMILGTQGSFMMEREINQISLVVFSLLLNEYFPVVYNSLKLTSDFKFLSDALRWSMANNTSPLKIKQTAEKEGSSLIMKNREIFNEYCKEQRFYQLLRNFFELTSIDNFADSMNSIKSKLTLIG